MLRVFVPVALPICALMVIAGDAFAWDGQRQGYVAGAALGSGFSRFTRSVWSSTTGEVLLRDTKLALDSHWRLGYAPTNSLQISWMSSVSWFELERVSGDMVIIANGLRGLALTYYFRPESPSPLLTAGVGFSSWSKPFEKEPDTTWGVGLIVGAGYEVLPHWSIEWNLAWKDSPRGVILPKEQMIGYAQDRTNALSFEFTVNVIGY